MPSFAGRSGKALGQNLGTEASPPILLYQPDLASYYPSRARRAQITGKTQLSLEISANGEVTSIKITKSSPEGVFERAARRAAKKLHYKPSIRNGRPQSSKIAMEFIWKLD
jgi:protein TonB